MWKQLFTAIIIFGNAGASSACAPGSACEDAALEADLFMTPGVRIIDEADYRIIAHPQCSSPYMLRDIQKQIRVALDQAPRLLNMKWDTERYGENKLQVFITAESIRSHAAYPDTTNPKPHIYLPCHVVRDIRAPVIHEFTHLMVPWLGNMSLREGIADWVQFTLRPGRPASFVPSFDDPHEIAKDMAADYPGLLALVGQAGVPKFHTSEERFAFYHLSRSYVFFALKNRKIDELVRSVKAASQRFEKANNTTRLHAQWVSHVQKSTSY